ncbi:hypothetical protein LCGC14_0384380 [marine sediment metagenome]|uniref:Right handed beta helix domain-containing protein n=1 Tax=marine sediment metagenome TaxID=412755 RepID=A0A0F9T791_9ZZZZ
MKTAILIILLFLPSLAWSGTYYVRQGSSGTWGVGAGQCGHAADGPSNPCSLRFGAVDNVVAGDTVRLQDDGGTFTGNFAGLIGGFDGSGDPTMASGTAGNVITWEAESGDTPEVGYSGGDPARQFMVNLRGLAYHTFTGIKFTGSANHLISLDDDSGSADTDHIIFDGNIFYSTSAGAFTILEILSNAHDIIIRNNTFDFENAINRNHDDGLNLQPAVGNTLEYILIEDNIFGTGAGHSMFSLQTAGGTLRYVTIRNNVIENTAHTAMTIYGSSPSVPQYILFENNVVKNAGVECSLGSCNECVYCSNDDKAQARDIKNNGQFASIDSIYRYNSFVKGGNGISFEPANGVSPNDNRLYNNVFYKNAVGFRVPNFGFDVDGNVLLNNVFRDNTEASNSTNYPFFFEVYTGVSNYDIEVGFNYEDETDDSRYRDASPQTKVGSFNELDADPGGTIFHDNEEGSVSFFDEANFDFTLNSGSPAIDAGTNLTTVDTDDSCNGAACAANTTLEVVDSRFFQDGTWAPTGEVSADFICIGASVAASACVQISSITDTDTIELASGTTRSDGDKVWLQKDSDGTVVLQGSGTDMGAEEFNEDAPEPPPSGGGQRMIGVVNCSGCEFK